MSYATRACVRCSQPFVDNRNLCPSCRESRRTWTVSSVLLFIAGMIVLAL